MIYQYTKEQRKLNAKIGELDKILEPYWYGLDEKDRRFPKGLREDAPEGMEETYQEWVRLKKRFFEIHDEIVGDWE